MERGQSTVEVAIAFPVVTLLVWWALTPPLVGVRALAARAAALSGARQASVEDNPEGRQTGRTVSSLWKRMGGNGGGKEVDVTFTTDTVNVNAWETTGGPGRMARFTLVLRRERD